MHFSTNIKAVVECAWQAILLTLRDGAMMKHLFQIVRRIFSIIIFVSVGDAVAACGLHSDPVVTLAHGSRYAETSRNRSVIDTRGKAALERALDPIDDFIRDVSKEANTVLKAVRKKQKKEARAKANCIVSAMAKWANAGALTNLETYSARISVGSRIAGIALPYFLVQPHATNSRDKVIVEAWLKTLSVRQAKWWETGAKHAVKHGNLRAWEALGFVSVGLATGSDKLVKTGKKVAEFILCTVNEDGSLPWEMRRGKYALRYQLHALQPLTLTAAILKHKAGGRSRYDLRAVCNYALQRAGEFAVRELQNGGRFTRQHADARQSYFDGTHKLRPYEMAWAVPFLTLFSSSEVSAYVRRASNFRNSKLGGDQKLIWANYRPAPLPAPKPTPRAGLPLPVLWQSSS